MPALAYHDLAREDVFALLPENCCRVLEIGAGTGATIAALKKIRPVFFSAGVEKFGAAAEKARGHVDHMIVGDIEALELPDDWRNFDLILCLDVLEHLVDPWRVVEMLHSRLTYSGSIIASIPNVNHISATLPLVLRGDWTLRDAGILDRTHLRFFVKSTAIDLMTCSGLHLQAIKVGGLPARSKRWWANKLTAGIFERFLTLQYHIRVGN